MKHINLIDIRKEFEMKKTLFATLIVALLAVGIVGSVAAQSPTPEYPGGGFGPGMRGSMGGYGYTADGETNPMHDTMITAFAEKLGLSVDEINAAIEDGNTVYDLASEAGIAAEDFYGIMLETRQAAIAEGVAQGYFTQEQADWMSQRQQGHGSGACFDGTADGQTFAPRGGGRWATAQ
jgi:hypothetical protein